MTQVNIVKYSKTIKDRVILEDVSLSFTGGKV